MDQNFKSPNIEYKKSNIFSKTEIKGQNQLNNQFN